jgi:hypothetical protein
VDIHSKTRGLVTPSAAPSLDFTLPWSAGATLWPVVPIALVWWAFYLTGVPRSILEKRGYEPARRERAAAISYYTTAPLTLLLPAALLALLAQRIDQSDLFTRSVELKLILAANAGALFCGAVAIIRTFICVVAWAKRTSHCQFGGTLLAIVQLLGCWLLGLLVLGALFPWCVGFLWIVIDGFR